MKKIILFATSALFIATLPAHADSIAKGKAAVEKYGCVSCHGANLNAPIDPSYPKLAGQPATYTEHALIAYKRGSGKTNSRNNAIMGGQVAQLSHQEISDIASYIASLPGSLVVRK